MKILPFGLVLLCAGTGQAAPAIKSTDALALKRAVAAQKGHPVLVNFWATWCPQCVAEYPAIVQLSRRYGNKGLRVIGVTADKQQDAESKVAPFLKRQGATFPQFLIRARDPEDFVLAWDTAWTDGALPRTYLYDRRGRRVQVLAGEQTYAAFAQAVKPLLTR